MAKSNKNTPTSNAVLADADAEIRFGFSARSSIQSEIGIDENSPHLESVNKPMPAKTDIIFADDMGTAVLTPAGYTITMPIRRIDKPTLEDKFQTALAYLDSVITDNSRKFNPQIIIAGSNPTSTFNKFEDTLREWGQEHFETNGEKKILGSNKQVSLKYRGGPAVEL